MSLEERDRLAAMLYAQKGPPPADPAARRAAFDGFVARAWPAAPPAPEPFELTPGLMGRLVGAPSGTTDRLLLWFHGGAFAVGSSATHAPVLARLAEAADIAAVLPDYRLVPEHPFPAAHEDAVAALDWVLERTEAGAVAVGGDSAGGNLAVAAVQARLERGLSAPGAVVLLSPYLDLSESGESFRTRAMQDPFVDTGSSAAGAYRGGAPATDPRVSPLFGRVEGFPPTLIQVGSDEALFDDARGFARRLWEAGRPCVFQEWVAQFHAWHMFHDQLEEARWALAQVAVFLRRQLPTERERSRPA